MIGLLHGVQTMKRERERVCRLAYLDSSLDLGVVRCRRRLSFFVLVLGGRGDILAGRPVVVAVLRRVIVAVVGNPLLPTPTAAAFLEAVGEVAGGVVIGPRNARRIAERECEEIGKCGVN